jgi:hypothetical protein
VTNELWKPPVDAPPVPSLDRYKMLALSGFSAAALINGAFDSAGNPLIAFLVSLPMATAATMWCIVDAASRGDYYPHSFRWVTMITWPIAVPIYLVRTRKGRGVLLALAALVAMLLLEGAGAAAGHLVQRLR